MDLVQNNKGPFDPASYGGDAQKALLVRQAFLHGVPRTEIVDKLIKPIMPDAEVRNSFVKTEGTDGYDEITAGNGSSDYAKTDPAKSLALLKQAGVKTPVKVRVMYDKDNVRRVNEFQLEKPALAKAGFDLVDNGSTEWSAKLGDGTLRRRVLRLGVDHVRRQRRPGDVRHRRGQQPGRLLEQEGRRAVRPAAGHLRPGRADQARRPRSRSSCTTTPSGSRSSSSRRRTSPTRHE